MCFPIKQRGYWLRDFFFFLQGRCLAAEGEISSYSQTDNRATGSWEFIVVQKQTYAFPFVATLVNLSNNKNKYKESVVWL